MGFQERFGVLDVLEDVHGDSGLLNDQILLNSALLSAHFNIIESIVGEQVLKDVIGSGEIKNDLAHVGELIKELEVEFLRIIALFVFQLPDFLLNQFSVFIEIFEK